MEIGQAREGDLVILSPEGDVSTPQDCAAIERAVNAAVGGGARSIVLDCTKAAQVGATAIRLLLLSQKRLTVQRGCLVLCGLSAATRKAFAISGFDRDFTIVATRQEATRFAAAIADSRKRAPGSGKAAADARPAAPSPAAAPRDQPAAAAAPAAPKAQTPAAEGARPKPDSARTKPEAAPARPNPLGDLVARTLAAGIAGSATLAPPALPLTAEGGQLAALVARTLAGPSEKA